MRDEQNFFFDPKSLEDGRKRKDRSQRPFQQGAGRATCLVNQGPG